MAMISVQWQAMPPPECRGGAVAVGNFDGVHLGHAALLAELRRRADALGGPAIGLTFDPRPLELLRPEVVLAPLATLADRALWMQQAGAHHVLVLHTTRELLSLSAEEFFDRILREQLGARALVEGGNFRFGRDRAGDVALLSRLCQGAEIGMTVCPPVVVDDREVSSSRVRAALVAGDVAQVARLLGRPHRLHGQVGVGQRRGQTLGFPTANLERLQTLAPGDGVYAARAILGAETWPAAVNVGPNPTFGEQARKVEAHLIGFQGDLYGRPLALDFVARLRDTRPFANVADLIAQLGRDVEDARRLA